MTRDAWALGVPLAQMREICDYWMRDDDWRRAEASINAFPQFITTMATGVLARSELEAGARVLVLDKPATLCRRLSSPRWSSMAHASRS